MKTLLLLVAVLAFATTCFGQTSTDSLKTQSKDSPTTLTAADQLNISVQKICPVSGAELGSIGEPVKIKAGEQVAFLCCKGCQGKKINPDHWATIQSRMAEAQGICPIMEKSVDSTMKSTVVNGQQIFVCCPPCIPKIQADPQASIKKVTARYTDFIAAEEQAASDSIHARAQKICPVSGKELGSMGDPVKVKVGDKEHAFLCCNGCVGKKLDAEHWKTIQTNLATAQRICPVMKQPVNAAMESTVVNGRKIFVCCPPCIKKIEEDPASFVVKLNEQIQESISAKK